MNIRARLFYKNFKKENILRTLRILYLNNPEIVKIHIEFLLDNLNELLIENSIEDINTIRKYIIKIIIKNLFILFIKLMIRDIRIFSIYKISRYIYKGKF